MPHGQKEHFQVVILSMTCTLAQLFHEYVQYLGYAMNETVFRGTASLDKN